MTKRRCGNRENDKYIDRTRDLTVPGKRDSPETGHGMRDLCLRVGRECRIPSRPIGSSGQSKSTRRALSVVSFQTKHPMGCLVKHEAALYKGASLGSPWLICQSTLTSADQIQYGGRVNYPYFGIMCLIIKLHKKK